MTLPKDFHVAIIMDGNGRWAQQQNKNRLMGHREGARTLKKIVQACPSSGVRYLTVFAFSSENWKRPAEEINGLMQLLEFYLRQETSELHREGVCLRIIGQRNHLPLHIQHLIDQTETLTKDNTRLGLQIALSYGGRDELVHAAQQIARHVQQNELTPDAITPAVFEQYLYTYPWPDPDLLIRTGGELRISNYLLWQLSYTEFIFCPEYWPAYTPEKFQQAIAQYQMRCRRFGGLGFEG